MRRIYYGHQKSINVRYSEESTDESQYRREKVSDHYRGIYLTAIAQ